MNLLHLQYFYVVAKEGGFSKASRVLRVNQPALSRMVKQLEESLNLVLLQREPRGVSLTKPGQLVFEKAGEIFSQVESLQRVTGQVSQTCQGELKVGASDLVAAQLLAAPVQKLVDNWPQVYPVVQTATGSELLRLVSGGHIEFALLFHTPSLPDSLAVTQRWPLRFRLVCLKAQSKNTETLSRFIGSREVDDTLTNKFPTLSKWRKHYPKAKISISSNSLLLHEQLVREGAGVSVLPEFLVERDLKSGRLVDLLPSENLVFNLKLIQKKSVGLSLEASTLIGLLNKNINA